MWSAPDHFFMKHALYKFLTYYLLLLLLLLDKNYIFSVFHFKTTSTICFSLSIQNKKYCQTLRKVDDNQDLIVAKYYRFKDVYLVISHWVSRRAFLSILRL